MQDSPQNQRAEPLVTKRSLGWAGASAFLACAACCAVPLLAVAGGERAAAVTAWWKPGLEPYAAGAAAVGTIAFFALRSAKARVCGTSCAVDASCCADAREQRRAS